MSAARKKSAPNPRMNAGGPRRRNKYVPDKAKTIQAATHHTGGRQA